MRTLTIQVEGDGLDESVHSQPTGKKIAGLQRACRPRRTLAAPEGEGR